MKYNMTKIMEKLWLLASFNMGENDNFKDDSIKMTGCESVLGRDLINKVYNMNKKSLMSGEIAPVLQELHNRYCLGRKIEPYKVLLDRPDVEAGEPEAIAGRCYSQIKEIKLNLDYFIHCYNIDKNFAVFELLNTLYHESEHRVQIGQYREQFKPDNKLQDHEIFIANYSVLSTYIKLITMGVDKTLSDELKKDPNLEFLMKEAKYGGAYKLDVCELGANAAMIKKCAYLLKAYKQLRNMDSLRELSCVVDESLFPELRVKGKEDIVTKYSIANLAAINCAVIRHGVENPSLSNALNECFRTLPAMREYELQCVEEGKLIQGVMKQLEVPADNKPKEFIGRAQ